MQHCSKPWIFTCRRTQLQQNQRHHINISTICRPHCLGSKKRRKHQCTGGKYHSKDRTILYKKKWRRTLEKMQITRQPLEHNIRHHIRKQLVNAAYSKLKYILEDRRTTLKVKIRILDGYVGSTFLYNSEMWTVTQDLGDQIDVIPIHFLRRILGIKWPEKISNTELYTRTQVAKWSQVILKRRLRWYGHIQRLDDNTPVRQALK